MDDFILQANRSALDYVQTMDFPKAWAKLRAAEARLGSKEAESLPNRLKLLALTYNNFSCYFKRKLKLEEALQFLSQALVLETQNADDPTAIAATHLNISAVYSDMKDHKSALTHAQFALDLLSRFAIEDQNPNLIIAYYNVAAEMEHLSMRRECIEIYKQGVAASKQKLGAEHPLTEKIAKAHETALSKVRVFRPRTGLATPEKRGTISSERSQHPLTALRSPMIRLKESLSTPKPVFHSFDKKPYAAFRPILSMRRLHTPVKAGHISKPQTPSPYATVDDCLSTVRRIQTILEGRRKTRPEIYVRN